MPRIYQRRDPQDRFWEKVDATGDCWEWTAGRNNAGYGSFHPANGVCVSAHRYAWELLVGPIPEGLVVDHLCRNRACCNPDHLRVVTFRENIMAGYGYYARRYHTARRETCQRGHPLTGENVGIQGPGWRYCKTCRRASRQRRSAERAA